MFQSLVAPEPTLSHRVFKIGSIRMPGTIEGQGIRDQATGTGCITQRDEETESAKRESPELLHTWSRSTLYRGERSLRSMVALMQ